MAGRKGSVVFLDLNNNSNTKGQTALSSDLGKNKKQAQQTVARDYKNPYESELLNQKYQNTVRLLGNLQKKTGAKANVIDDALALMDGYKKTVQASYALNKGIAGKDYLRIGDNEFQRQLEQTIYKYQYGSMDAAGLEKELARKGYQTNGQQKALTELNVIGRAKEMGAGMTPEERRRANYLDALADATNARPWTDGQNGNVKNNQGMALLGMGGETNQTTPQANAAQAYREMAQEMRTKDNITLADAEKYLAGQGWEYGFAKEHPGDLSAYADAFSRAGDIVNRAMINGVDKLNDKEKEVYFALQGNNGPELGAGLLGMGGMTNQELQGYTEWGRQQAAALQGVNGLYINHQPDRETQYILNQYRQTPEGAKQWAQDAIGTPEEEAAKDNEYFVTNRAHYQDVAGRADFAEISQMDPSKLNSLEYARVNGQKSTAVQGLNPMPANPYGANLGTPGTRFNIDQMNDDERAMYNAIVNTEGFTAGGKYLDYLQYELDRRAQGQTAAETQKFAENGFWGGLGASVVGSGARLLQGLGYADILKQRGLQAINGALGGDYRPINWNGPAQLPGTISEAATQGVQNQVDLNVNIFGQDMDLFDFGYGTLMDAANSVLAGATGFGEVLLAGAAAQSGAQEARKMGAPTDVALALGGLEGIDEGLFEHISLSKLYDEAKHIGNRTFKDFMTQIFAQAGINASEEYFTEKANMKAEEILLGDKDKYAKEYTEYLDLGLTPNEAKQRIDEEKTWRLVQAAAGGLVMGAFFGGTSTAVGDIATSSMEKRTGKNFDLEERKALAELASHMPDGSARAMVKEWKDEKGNTLHAPEYNPEKATAKQTGKLFRTIMQELPGEMKGTLRGNFVLSVLNSFDGISKEAADAIGYMMSGEQLNSDQIEALAKDKAGMELVNDLFGVESGKKAQEQQKETEQEEAGPGTVEFEPMPGMEEKKRQFTQKEPVIIKGQPNEQKPQAAGAGKVTAGEKINKSAWQGDAEAGNVRPNEQSQEAEQGGAAYKPREKRLPVMVLEGNSAQNAAADAESAEVREARTTPSIEEKQEQGPDGRQIVDAGEGTKGEGKAVMGFQVDEESGAVTAEMEDGSRQDVEELPISDAQKEIAQETADMDAEAQGTVMQNYDGKRPAKQYAQGMKNVYQAARKGQSLEEIRSLYGEDLDDPQRKAAWEAGRAAYEKEEQRALDDTRRNQDKAKADGYNFKVLEREDAEQQHKGVYLARVRNAMTRSQEIQLAVLEDVLNKKGIPVQIRVYDTMDDKNGSYQAGSNIVNVALDAEGGLINRTVSHELYHFVKEWNQEAAGKLQAFVIDTLKGTATFDLDKRRQDIARQYRDRAGQELTADAIDEEIAAESMLDAIDTQENLQAFYKNADKSLIERITNWIKDTVAKIRDAMARIGRNHPEVEAMRGNLAALEKIQNDLLQAAQTAGQNYLAARAGLNSQAAQDADVMAYQAEMSRAVTPELAQEARNGLESKLFARYYADMGGDLGGLEYEDAFQRFQAAMEVFGSGESKSLAWAFNQAKIPVPKQGMNSVMAYAARQMAEGERQAQEAASVKNELKAGNTENERYDYLKPFEEQIEDVIQGNHPENDTILIGGTPKVLQDIGFTSLPLGLAKGHAKEMLGLIERDKNHEFGEEFVKRLPELVNNPVAIIESRSEKGNKKESSVVLILDDYNPNTNDHVIGAVEIGRELQFNNMPYDGHLVTSVHGRENAMNMLKYALSTEINNGHGVFYIDQKRANQLAKTPQINAAIADRLHSLGKDGSIHSIKDESGVVKAIQKNQTETQQFDRWFGNSVVKNADDTPKVMYHGTNAQFWTFDKSKAKYSGAYGRGFYFTDQKSHAGQYGNAMKVYLKAENPLQMGDNKITKQQLIRFLEAIAEDEDYGLENYGYGATPRTVANDVFDGRGDFNYIQDINATAIGDFVAAIKLFNEVNGTKYDSIIAPTETVVFEPTQIKSATDNIGTFDPENPDIRYSFRADEAADTEQQALEDVRADAELYSQIKQDEDARAALLMLRQLHTLTTQGGADALIKPGAFEKRLSEIVSKIEEETGTKYGHNKLMAALRKVYRAMEQRDYNLGEILQYTRGIMQEVLEKAPGVLVEQDETTKEVIRILRTRPFYLSEEQKSEIAGTYGALGDYMRKNFGKMKIRKQSPTTASLEDVWREDLAPLLPGTFAEDTSPLDMPGILDAWLENANEKKFAGEFGANIGAYATNQALNAMLDFYDVPGALKTKEEIRQGFQERFNEQRAQINQLKETARGAVDQARMQYEERYRNRIEKDQARKQETERKQTLRNQITRDVKAINTLNTSMTDTRHVPESMRAATLAAVEPFINNSGVFSGAAQIRLAHEYELLKQRAGEIGGFDEDILETINGLGERLNGRRLSQLTEQELQDLADITGNLRKIIADTNEAFVNGRKTTIDALSARLKQDMRNKGPARQGRPAEMARALSYRETTPTYFADRVGGVIRDMIRDLYAGQNTWAFAMNKAKAFLGEDGRKKSGVMGKYHVNDWINDKQHARFTTQHGDMIELNRQEALSLYALWKRETSNKLQNANHLRVGGFMYDKGTRYEGVDTLRPHPLTESDMQMIRSYLTDEQMAFADEMVKYLSEDMAKIGNETSMRLYGYEKFKEGYYFPYDTDHRYLVGDLTQDGEQVKQPKSAGITKALMQNAATPITVKPFTEVWASHVNQMGLYAGFAEAIDTMNRVFNQRASGEVRLDSVTGEEFVISPESNWIEMEKALGAEGVKYLKTLARDVSGGVRADERSIVGKGLSLFKKGSVAGNLSVALQQPTAYARAMMMVNPQYLLSSNPTKLAQNITNMYKYSGVALIKNMGRFDTGTGKGAVAWMQDAIQEDNLGKRALDTIDTVTGMGAEKMDEWTWGILWGAIERETQHTRPDLNAGTEEFYQAVAERFEDVVNHTQVYDSVLSKSEWMRSNTTMDKMVTSFMAEPTLTLNMLQDAIVNFRQNGGGKKVARAAATFLINSALVALAKSIVTATRRKDDEGRTWLEKYLAEAAGNFADDVSPYGLIGMIPWARDAVSLLEGYSVERSDMDAMEQLVNAYKVLNNDNKSVEDKIQAASGAVGNIFGIPVKNLWRDTEAILRNLFGGASANEPTTGRDIKYSVMDKTGLAIPFTGNGFGAWDSSRAAYYDRMEEALKAGDMDRYNEMRGYVEDTLQVQSDTVDSGIKKEIKESLTAGLISDDRAIELLEALGMDSKKAFDTAYKWAQTAGHEDEEDFEYNKYGQIQSMIAAGQDISAEVKRFTDHGTSEKTMESAVKGAIKSLYTDGTLTESQTESSIKKYLGITDKEEIHWLMDEWAYKRDNGAEASYSKYVDVYDAVRNGTSLTAAMKEMSQNGYTEKDVRGQIKSKIAEWYKKGELTKSQAESKLKQYAGITDSNDLYWAMDQMDYEKNNPKGEYRKYNEFYKAVETGNGLQSTVKRYLDHGVKAETMASQITSQYKAQYVELYRTNKTKAAELKARLLTAYAALGYDRSKKQKDIDKWVK